MMAHFHVPHPVCEILFLKQSEILVPYQFLNNLLNHCFSLNGWAYTLLIISFYRFHLSIWRFVEYASRDTAAWVGKCCLDIGLRHIPPARPGIKLPWCVNGTRATLINVL